MATDEHFETHDRPERRRYEIELDGRTVGYSRYRLQGELMTFLHTEVDPAYAGRGLGSRLAAGALDDVRARGLRVVALCPFIAGYIDGHPPYQDLLVDRAEG